MRNVTLKAVSGVRNDVPLERFGKSDLASAVNVDIDKTGKISRRAGQRRVATGTDVHSLYQAASRVFFVDGTVLHELHPDFSTSPLKSDLATGRRMTYLDLNQTVYFMNGVDAGVIVGPRARRLGVEVPPSVYAVAGVALTTPTLPTSTFEAMAGTYIQEGTYGVTMTYVRNDGTESGARGCTFVTTTGTASLTLALPVSTDPDVSAKRLYITERSGEIPYLVCELANSVTTFEYASAGPRALPCTTQFLSPMPSGDVLGVYNGRLYVGVGNLLVYSEPYNYEACDMRQNYIQFPDRVTIIAPVKDGIFLGTERGTLFLSGDDPAKFESAVAVSVGSVIGTLTYADPQFVTKEGLKGPTPMWTTTRGVCAGSDSGVFTELTSGRFILPNSTGGAGMYRYQHGMPHYLSILY